MKCKLCQQDKQIHEFNLMINGKPEGKCKECRKTQRKLNSKPKIKFEPINDGYACCNICFLTKDITEFSVNRNNSNGREKFCKTCKSLIALKKRREHTIFKPFNVSDNHLKAEYHTKNCEVCDKHFFPGRSNHKRCEDCSTLTRQLQGSINPSKNKRKTILEENVTKVNLSIELTKLYISTTNCSYCGREFNLGETKNLDHIIPVCLGGKNTFNNFTFCCKHCNFSKNSSEIKKWFQLCSLISNLNLNSVENCANNLPKLSDKNRCVICSSVLTKMRHDYCCKCSVLVKKLSSSLSSGRGKKSSYKVSYKDVRNICQKWINSNKCTYCTREFTEINYKSPDHIRPLCLGGTNTADNIAICCIECNKAKARLNLNDWIELCKMISNKNKVT